MNWITIFGICVIALGTFLTYYGSSLNNKKDKQEITDKIEGFNEKLESISTQNIPSPEKEKQVEQVKQEYMQWAEKFVSNKEEQLVELDKTDVALREEKISLNKQWHSIYSDFFTSITEMVNAYNSASGQEKVKFIENQQFPASIYSATPDNFKVIIQFNDNLHWTIWLKVREPIKNKYLPSINISVAENKDFLKYQSFNWGDLSFQPYSDNQIRVETLNIFDKANFEEKYELGETRQELNDLLKKAFEYQILLIEK